MKLENFWNLHRGQTCLIAGLGENLKLTPPEWFNYPSFSVNTILRYEGWRPTFYVGLDHRLKVENGDEIKEKYWDIPKFIPTPDWDDFECPNCYRFVHRTGALYVGGQLASNREALTRHGIGYYRVMDAVFQIAWHMGFTTMLVVGVQHKPNAEKNHFWGLDPGTIIGQPIEYWFEGYRYFSHEGMGGVRVLNISENTYVPENVMPRDDWQKWKNT